MQGGKVGPGTGTEHGKTETVCMCVIQVFLKLWGPKSGYIVIKSLKFNLLS